MGSVSEKYADIIILTSEDPKDEDPKTIINDIHPKCSSLSIFDLRDLISKKSSISKIRELAIQSLTQRYSYQFSLFLYDIKNSGITEEDLRTLTGCNLSYIH